MIWGPAGFTGRALGWFFCSRPLFLNTFILPSNRRVTHMGEFSLLSAQLCTMPPPSSPMLNGHLRDLSRWRSRTIGFHVFPPQLCRSRSGTSASSLITYFPLFFSHVLDEKADVQLAFRTLIFAGAFSFHEGSLVREKLDLQLSPSAISFIFPLR